MAWRSNAARVIGPVGISVADARVEEGQGVVLAFAVTLIRASSRPLTVDYATSERRRADGCRLHGCGRDADLPFQAGDSSAAVEVRVLNDRQDEEEETLTLRLSNVFVVK